MLPCVQGTDFEYLAWMKWNIKWTPTTWEIWDCACAVQIMVLTDASILLAKKGK